MRYRSRFQTLSSSLLEAPAHYAKAVDRERQLQIPLIGGLLSVTQEVTVNVLCCTLKATGGVIVSILIRCLGAIL
jgi:hypothetical protein